MDMGWNETIDYICNINLVAILLTMDMGWNGDQLFLAYKGGSRNPTNNGYGLELI